MATTESRSSGEISIHRMVPSDGFESASVSRIAFLEDGAMQQQYLHPLSPAEIEINNRWFGRRFGRICALPHVHAFKAVDDATGKIVGGTIFVGPEDSSSRSQQQQTQDKSEQQHRQQQQQQQATREEVDSKVDAAKKDDDTPDFINVEMTKKMQAASAGAREKFLGGTEADKWTIMSLTVHPEYRRRGIARMLMQKGFELVDADGMDCHVRSSYMARPAYENVGFEPVGTFVYLEGYPLATAMIRRARAKTTSPAVNGSSGGAEAA